MYPKIVGFSGKAGSGKDTAGKYLVDRYGWLHYFFAKPLKEGCNIMFNLSEEEIKNKEKKIDRWDKSPRQLYQLLGTDVARAIDDKVWIKGAQNFIDNNPDSSIVITDVRFPNEADWIRDNNGIVIFLEREIADIEHCYHSSENSLSGEDVDFYIENDRTIDALHLQIYNCLEEYNIKTEQEELVESYEYRL